MNKDFYIDPNTLSPKLKRTPPKPMVMKYTTKNTKQPEGVQATDQTLQEANPAHWISPQQVDLERRDHHHANLTSCTFGIITAMFGTTLLCTGERKLGIQFACFGLGVIGTESRHCIANTLEKCMD